MDQKIHEDEKNPQEIPTKNNPNEPKPEKAPNVKTDPNPSKNNPINPKENH